MAVIVPSKKSKRGNTNDNWYNKSAFGKKAKKFVNKEFATKVNPINATNRGEYAGLPGYRRELVKKDVPSRPSWTVNGKTYTLPVVGFPKITMGYYRDIKSMLDPEYGIEETPDEWLIRNYVMRWYKDKERLGELLNLKRRSGHGYINEWDLPKFYSRYEKIPDIIKDQITSDRFYLVLFMFCMDERNKPAIDIVDPEDFDSLDTVNKLDYNKVANCMQSINMGYYEDIRNQARIFSYELSLARFDKILPNGQTELEFVQAHGLDKENMTKEEKSYMKEARITEIFCAISSSF